MQVHMNSNIGIDLLYESRNIIFVRIISLAVSILVSKNTSAQKSRTRLHVHPQRKIQANHLSIYGTIKEYFLLDPMQDISLQQ